MPKFFASFSQNKFIKYANWVVFAYATLLFGFISLLAHYSFHTFYCDCGIHAQAMYEYSQGTLARFPGNPEMYMLGDHFSLTLIVYSYLFFPIFQSYTPSVIEFASVFLGAWGILCYLKRIYPKERIYSPWILFYFFTNWGLIAAIAYQYHNNTVAAMLIPWLALFYREQKWGKFYLVLIWTIISQENVPLYNFMLLLTLLTDKIFRTKVSANNRWEKIWQKLRLVRWQEILPLIICIGYFLLLVTYVLPHLHSAQITGRYAHWGNGVGEILKNIILEPWRIIEPYKQIPANEVRGYLDGLAWVSISGIFLPFIRPVWLIALLGYTAQRFLASTQSFWSQHYQYSVELAPFLTLVLIDVIHKYNNGKIGKTILGYPRKITIPLTILIIAAGIAGHSNGNIGGKIREYLWIFRTDALQRDVLKQAIDLVPDNEILLTQGRINPHVVRRWAGQQIEFDDTGQRNIKERANYMLLAAVPALIDTCDTMTRKANTTYRRIRELRALVNDSSFECIFHKKDVYLLRKKAVEKANFNN